MQIRELVNEIENLARQDLEPTIFYGEFLQRVLTALAAVGGAVWMQDRDKRLLELKYQINLRQSFCNEDEQSLHCHARLLHHVVNTNLELLVPPHSTIGNAENPTNYLLILVPIRAADQCIGVVEVFQRPTAGPASQRGYLRFLVQMCTAVDEYVERQSAKKTAPLGFAVPHVQKWLVHLLSRFLKRPT